jgi:hypothetical protein
MVEGRKMAEESKKKSRWTLGNVVSGIIVLIIFLVLFSPGIASWAASRFEPGKLELQFVPTQYPYLTSSVLQGDVAASSGVSGYSARIYISFESTDVPIGGTVKIHVEINNTGTPLSKPYFYAFLVNTTGAVVSVFPQDVYVAQGYKLSPWPLDTQGTYLQLGTYGSYLGISRQTMISGQGDYWNASNHEGNSEVWLEKQTATDPSQIGQWELWVFLLDETYQTSTGGTLSSQNAITYTTAFFNVTPEAAPAPVNSAANWLWLSQLLSVLFTIGSTFGLFKRLSPWIDAHNAEISSWRKRNQLYILFSAACLFLYILFLLLGA